MVCKNCGQPIYEDQGIQSGTDASDGKYHHVTGYPNPCSKPEPKEEPMTVDELLAKLDAEYEKLESQLPEHYLAYGRYRYDYPGDTGSYHYDKQRITDIRERQKNIRSFQYRLKQEQEVATA